MHFRYRKWLASQRQLPVITVKELGELGGTRFSFLSKFISYSFEFDLVFVLELLSSIPN